MIPKLTKVELLLATLVLGVIGFFFYQTIIDFVAKFWMWILGGGVTAEALRQKSKKAKIVADEHETLAQQELEESYQKQMAADLMAGQAKDKIESIKNDKKTGTNRKRFTIS